MKSAGERASEFCRRAGVAKALLLAPMAGACPPALSIAVANAGGAGACGALLMTPADIAQWVERFRAESSGPFQINLWVPDPEPVRDAAAEGAVRAFLRRYGPEVPAGAGDARPVDFASQCEALLAARPTMASSVMGLFPVPFVTRLKAAGILWIANVSTVAEAVAAEAAGADLIVAQGSEAGGHRGTFDANGAEARAVGLCALVPAVVDAVTVPVIAAGGIADARGVAAAFALGASAAMVGTGFMRTPEAGLPPAWADARRAAPEDTVLTRAFSGRAGRSLATGYVRAVAAEGIAPAPYPVQRGLTAAMRAAAIAAGDVERMQAWAGQSARLALALPAREVYARLAGGLPGAA